MTTRLLAAAVIVALSVPSAEASGGGHGASANHSSGGHGSASSGHGAAAPTDEPPAVSEPSADGSRAVRLGEFQIRVYRTAAARKDLIVFILHARVAKEHLESFESHYVHRSNKIREQVLIATRLVPIEDYDDPEMRKFRRRILLRIRRAVPDLPIDELYISDFSLVSESM